MKIVIICDTLFANGNNGTALATLNLANYLKNKGHTVTIVGPDVPINYDKGIILLKQLNLGPINSYVAKNGVALCSKNTKLIEQICKDADIVHGMVPFTACKSALKYCRKHKIPFTTGFHVQAQNFTSHVFLGKSRLATRITYKGFFRKYYKKVDAIHYPTEFIKNLVSKYDKKKIPSYIISNGVDRSLFYPKTIAKTKDLQDKFVVIMCGRYTKEKKQQNLIKAVLKSKHEKDIQIIFAGEGPTLNYLIKQSKNLTNKPIFKFSQHNKLNEFFWMSDLYVHTSSVEIEAISCLEAISSGLVPLISNSKDSATSKFVLDDKCVYNSKSINELTEKIDYWFEHPKEKELLKNKYQDFVNQFDFNLSMEKMEKMLIEVKQNYAK